MGETIGFIGLGVMGASMARNLLRAGHEVFVFNRTRDREEPLLKEGARRVENPTEMGSKVRRLFLCVTNGAAVDEMLLGDQGAAHALQPESVVVDFSTIAPSEARVIQQELSAKKIAFLDAPVTGGDVGARNGTLTIMIGGEHAVLEKVRPLLECLGKRIVHVGKSGNGQLTKCVNQIAVVGSIAAMTEAMFFAERLGLDRQITFDVLKGGAANSWQLENYGPRLLAGDLKPGFHIKHLVKDLRIVLNESGEAHMSLPVTSLMKEQFTALMKGGGGELGVHALIKLYERMNSAV